MIYYEPARFAILNFFKDMQTAPAGSAVILAVPEHLLEPSLTILSEEFAKRKVSKITEDDINVYLAIGAQFWSILSLQWILIPTLTASIAYNLIHGYITKLKQAITGEVEPEYAEHVKGMIGTKWTRDTRRDYLILRCDFRNALL